MAATYTGRWRGRYTPGLRNPNLADVADDRHLTPVDPPTSVLPSPKQLPAGPDYLYGYPVDDFMLPAATAGGQTFMEPTTFGGLEPVGAPTDGHDVGEVQVYRLNDPTTTTPYGPGTADDEARVAANLAREQDYGSADVTHQGIGGQVMRRDTDTYRTVRYEEDIHIDKSDAHLMTGRNAYPQNNPDGPPPQGHIVMRWIDRQVTRRPFAHNMMPLRPYRANVARATTPPQDPNQYTSPYPTLVPPRLMKLASGQTRRVPRPWDEDTITDGTDSPNYAQPDYWGM